MSSTYIFQKATYQREDPILKNETVETARQLIIARIAKLKILNGTEIPHNERRGAEHNYLKLSLPVWLETEKYGIADIPSAKLKVEMVSNVMTVEFVCPDDPRQSRGIKRKLLKDVEVQKMIGLVQKSVNEAGPKILSIF
ncbi:tubulin-specific chaperone E-like isoform X2 [Temnothorax curvispinosus]|uniref:Tubulin-specific chaperone E-like isoform X2 n=1 Tax=Temnothorax curvispinosus TaxID=300111 RepID=A0A6J1QJX3_9HYME|nr:tubulin-specific chaperone E-like isoform X2 [Temnothorax curvispinosus]